MVIVNDEFLLGYEVNFDMGDVLFYEFKLINILLQFGKLKQIVNIDLGVNLFVNGDFKDFVLFDIIDFEIYNCMILLIIYDFMG